MEGEMNYQAVTSSNIEAIGYDESSETLGVKFRNGVEWHYRPVPPATYVDLIEAESIGKAFHALIRGQFPGVKQEPATETAGA